MDNITRIKERLTRLQAEKGILKADIDKRRDSDDAEVIALLEEKLAVCERSIRCTDRKVSGVLKHIRDPKLHNILKSKIYTTLTWEEMAEQMNCDVRTLYRLKKKAETEFNRYLMLTSTLL